MTHAENERLRIFHIVRRAEGGMRRHVQTLLQHLPPDRFQQIVCAPTDFIRSLPEELRRGLVSRPVEIGDDVSPLGSAARTALLAREIRRSGADIVHCHGYRAGMVGVPAARLAGRPAILTAHNVFPAGSSKVARIALRSVSASARNIIAVSPAVKRSLVAVGVSEPKIVVIPNGVKIPDDLQRPPTVLDLKLEPNIKLILCVARLTEVKGVRFLIEAAPMIASAVPNARVVVIGDGPDRDELVQIASEQAPGMVTFTGYREDVSDLMLLADVVAIPSLAEAQSLVLVEAMARARPVVASSVGGMADIVKDMQTGLLVPAKDPLALAQAIVRVLTDGELANIICVQAREHAKSEFDMRLMVTRTSEAYVCKI